MKREVLSKLNRANTAKVASTTTIDLSGFESKKAKNYRKKTTTTTKIKKPENFYILPSLFFFIYSKHFFSFVFSSPIFPAIISKPTHTGRWFRVASVTAVSSSGQRRLSQDVCTLHVRTSVPYRLFFSTELLPTQLHTKHTHLHTQMRTQRRTAELEKKKTRMTCHEARFLKRKITKEGQKRIDHQVHDFY